MGEKSLSERVLDMAQQKRASKAQRLFMVHGEEILQALDEGLPKKWVWETLRQEGECVPTYERFLIQLRRFLEGKRPQKSTPEGRVAKASPIPAVRMPEPAPKTAGTPTSEVVKPQVPTKPPTQPKTFDWHAPTPEDFRKMMGD